MKLSAQVVFSLTALLICTPQMPAQAADAQYRITSEIEIDKVPSWFPVGFALLTDRDRQYVSYYNEQHQMMVATRRLDQAKWQKVTLPTKVGWDSHNYITMAVDAERNLHIAGNMHCVPLIYFRMEQPGDIGTLKQQPMTGQDEKRCTYPKFLLDAEGNLLFTYRSGSSGNGRRFYNRYDLATKSWSRFLDTPLFEGEGKRNAYPLGPEKGPDGRFHVIWVWRDTPDCATNHDLSYMRSDDLQHWESAGGHPATLPITIEQTELVVDPVPPGGGIINGCERLSFDSQQRPIIAYHRLDENRHMQVYVARFEQGRWNPHPVTDWDKTITFSGGGAMPFIGIAVSRLEQIEPGVFFINYRHRDYGSGRVVLDEQTLQPVDRKVSVPRELPSSLGRTSVSFAGISVKIAQDLNSAENADVKYLLRWEALPPHHDRPRQPPLPPASTLKLIKLEREK